MGLLTNVLLSTIRLPRDIHRFAFRQYPDRVALQFADRSITYRQLEERGYRLAQAWHALGVRPGDAVFSQVGTGGELFEIRVAAAETGAVLTGFHSLHSPEFVTTAANAVTPKLLIVDRDFAPGTAEAMHAAHPGVPVWLVGPDGEFEAQLRSHDAVRSKERFSSAAPFTLGFTSGTTGVPKGLISSQSASVTSLKMVIRNFTGKRDRTANNISLSPIHLVGGGTGLVFPTMIVGGTLVVLDAYTPESLIAAVTKFGVTRLFLTPSHLIDLLDMPAKVDRDLATVNHIVYGTAPMPAAKLEEAINRFGPIFQQGYGQAEVLPPVTLLRPEEHMVDGELAPRSILQSCGKIARGVHLRIVGPDGQELPAGMPGDIQVKSPTRLQTYLDRTQNEGVILADGYFRTGDEGYLDQSGYLHVLDRGADLIRAAGSVIYPRTVEEEAHDHPAVKECCLVELAGKPVLFVSRRSQYGGGSDDAVVRELHALLEGRLGPELMPDEIRIIDAIPRSFLGKVLRREVKARMGNDDNA